MTVGPLARGVVDAREPAPGYANVTIAHIKRIVSSQEMLARGAKLIVVLATALPIDGIAPASACSSGIWRVNAVKIGSADLNEGRLRVAITLELANREHWSGHISIDIAE